MSGTSGKIKLVLLLSSSMTVMAGALITPVLPDIVAGSVAVALSTTRCHGST
ncbi:MAG: hypothetical protein IBX50_14580 [Marinospirillum sp.]|uniref:hypothetical protein n=1 Tax=Marinospirillum sp. TaxID=2183934 RepID=UPI0019E7E97F|nr:hypothetical protein [Marinospirillum sp.]MBE0507914.1 hypothetical protein [Marinospirillum sp.]